LTHQNRPMQPPLSVIWKVGGWVVICLIGLVQNGGSDPIIEDANSDKSLSSISVL
jgi:hypothetical protein